MTLASNKILVRVGGRSYVLLKDHNQSMKAVQYRLIKSYKGKLYSVTIAATYLEIKQMPFRVRRQMFRNAATALEKRLCSQKSN